MRALRSVFATALGLLLIPLAATTAHAADVTLTAVAQDSDGTPLPFVHWQLHSWENGEWTTLQFGPKLTNDRGQFTWKVAPGSTHRICFSDTYYDRDATPTGFWQPTERHRDTCWPNATTLDNARTWTAPTDANSSTLRVTLPKAGLGMAPVEPFLSGDFSIGKPLTVVGQEGWRPTNATFSYQWFSRTGNAMFAPIPGATGVSFTPSAAYEGHWLYAQVTAKRTGYKSVQLNTPLSMAGGAHVIPSSPLAISGVPAPGNTVTASFGQPQETYGEITWYADGVPQDQVPSWNGNASSMPLDASHAGTLIEARLKLYGQDSEGNYRDGSDSFHRVQVQVSGTRATQTLPPASAPRGTATVGRVLQAPAEVTPDRGATLTYQWLRNAQPIAGATAARYTVKQADLGARVSVQVTVKRPGWLNTYVAYSDATVTKGALKRGTVKIKGKAKAGSTVKATAKGWGPKPITVRHQWLRSGKAIKGATKATYRLKKADRGKVVKVRITATKTKYAPATKLSKGLRIRR